jgi:hypothetical protein
MLYEFITLNRDEIITRVPSQRREAIDAAPQ